MGAATVLKFLQKLALDFPYICLQFFPGYFYRQMYRKFFKNVLGLLAHVTPSNFFSRIHKSEALVYNSCLFSKRRFYGNYSTLDFHTNTAISHAFACSLRWCRKPWQGLLALNPRLNLTRVSFSFVQKHFLG